MERTLFSIHRLVLNSLPVNSCSQQNMPFLNTALSIVTADRSKYDDPWQGPVYALCGFPHVSFA